MIDQTVKPFPTRRIILIELPDGEDHRLYWNKSDKFTEDEIKRIQLLLQDLLPEAKHE